MTASAFLGRRRVFLQIYLLIAAFSLFSVLAGGLFYYRSATARLTSLYIQSNHAFLAQSVHAIELIVDAVLDSAGQAQGDSIIKGLLETGGSTGALERQRVLSRLAEIRFSSRYIRSISLYLERSGQVYDTDYGLCALEGFPDRTWLKIYRDSDRQVTLVNQRDLQTSIHSDKPVEKVISLVSRLPFGASRCEGALIVNIDPGAIYADVVSRMNLRGGNDLVVLGPKGEVILGRKDALLLAAASLPQGGEPDPTVVRRIGGRAYLLTRSSSPVLGWDFVWVKSYDEVRALAGSLRSAVLLGSALLAATVLLLAILTARLTSRPMDELIDSLREQLAHSGIAAFRDIEGYVRGMAQRNAWLTERLERVLPAYRERFLSRLLTDRSLEPAEIEKRLRELDIDLGGHGVHVLALEVLNLYELEEAGFRLPVLKFSLSGLIESLVQNRRMAAYIVNADDAGLDVITSVRRDGDGRAAPLELAGELADAARECLGIELAVGVSSKGGQPSDLPDLYEESLAALSRRPVVGGGRVVSSEEVRRRPPARSSTLDPGWERLNRAICAGQGHEAQEALDEILETYRSRQHVCSQDLEDFVVRLYALISGYAGREPLPDDVTHREPVLKVLSDLKTLQGAQVFFRRLTAHVCAQRRKAVEDRDSEYLRRILAYIDANFDDPRLCMDCLSADLHLSPSRIYQVLKEKRGRTFVELLTERRIESACRLLLNNAKVKDVAQMVGYGSSKYFIRVFKKVKGATPHRYRKIVA